jgi:hypothetical protein
VLRREYAGFFAMALCYVLMDYMRAYGIATVDGTTFQWVRPSLYVLVAAGAITLVLRSLKHYTKVLSDSERD